MNEIKLGDRVKDRITGFEGTVTARIEYLYGCIQFRVQPDVAENGAQLKADWIDEDQLKIVKPSGAPKRSGSGGGFRDHPDD